MHEKSPAVKDMLNKVFGTGDVDFDGARNKHICFLCHGPADEFKDELSRREYQISRMCQKCQDKTFG